MHVYIGAYSKWYSTYNFIERLPISEENKDWLHDSWLVNKIDQALNIFNNQKRVVKVRIDNYDTWSMDHTLALIIIPMLKQLQATKVGSQLVDDEDVPPHMRHSDPKGEYGGDNWIHYKWEWILKELIWTFEHIVDEEWREKFWHGEMDWDDDKSTFWVDHDGMKEVEERISNGLRLFGKYYRGLWD